MTVKKDGLKEISGKIKYNQHDLIEIQPKNERQKQFLTYYYTNNIPLIFLHGYAGVGKTFIALHAALTQVLDVSTHYERVIVVRSAVESGNSQGFLKGTLEEKNEPYELPYKDICRRVFKEEGSHYQNLKENGIFEFLTTTFLRGLTLDNAIIIVEESQNLDYQELKTIITRIGEGSRVIMTGDMAQDDLMRKRGKSGMPQFMEVLENMKRNYFKVVDFQLEDVVRSGICSAFLISEFDLESKNINRGNDDGKVQYLKG